MEEALTILPILHVMIYQQAMSTKEVPKWKEAVKKDIKSFQKHGVFKPVTRKDIPSNAKIVISTWTMNR